MCEAKVFFKCRMCQAHVFACHLMPYLIHSRKFYLFIAITLYHTVDSFLTEFSNFRILQNECKRQAHDVMFKMEVIEVAEKSSNHEPGRQFKIDESVVRWWIQNKSKLELAYNKPGQEKKKKNLGVGKKPCSSTIEDELMEGIAHEREKQQTFSDMDTKMAHENGVLEFGAPRGWLSKFLCRFNLTIRRRTTTGQSIAP